MAELYVPEGYEVEETDERVGELTWTYTKRGAEVMASRHPAYLPTYHTRVERVTRNPFTFDRWVVACYQNRLVKRR